MNYKNGKKRNEAISFLGKYLGVSLVAGYALPATMAAAPVVAGSGITLFTFTSSLSSTFALNTRRTAFFNGASDLGGQYISNGFKFDEKINYGSVALSTIFKGGKVIDVFKSSFNIDSNLNITSNTPTEAAIGYISNRLAGSLNDKLLSKIPSSFSNASSSIYSNLGLGTLTETFGNILSSKTNEAIDDIKKNAKE